MTPDHTSMHNFGKTETRSSDTEHSGVTPTGRSLLRIGILTLGVLCVIQATLNISLRLVFYSKEETDRFPFSISEIADVCQIDQFQQNLTQSCSCCGNLLRRLLSKYQALERERDTLLGLTRNATEWDDSGDVSGFGSPEEDVFIPELSEQF